MTVVWEVLTLRPYIEGAKYAILTDHESLKCILNMADATGKLETCRLSIYEMKYDVFHRVLFKHQASDALSQLETTNTNDGYLEDEIPTLLVKNGNDYPHDMCFEFDYTS